MQRRAHSFIETVVNTAVGFVVSLGVWEVVIVPVWNLPVTRSDNLVITSIFTVVSIARGYVIRRVGNAFATQQKQKEALHDPVDRSSR